MPRNLKYLNGPTKAVRLPVALLPQIMAYVKWLDQVTAGRELPQQDKEQIADALLVVHAKANSQNQTAAEANEMLSSRP